MPWLCASKLYIYASLSSYRLCTMHEMASSLLETRSNIFLTVMKVANCMVFGNGIPEWIQFIVCPLTPTPPHTPTHLSINLPAGSKATLPLLLKFITAQQQVPSMGLQKKISIRYLPNYPTERLPKAECCFSLLHLPTTHRTRLEIYTTMDTAILGSGSFFYRE